MLTVDQLLGQLTKAVSYAYKKDGTSPGVLVSNLKSGKVYASIVRYGKDFPNGKKVVCNVTSDSVVSAISLLTGKFLTTVTVDKNPIDSLKDLVSNKGKDVN